MFGNFAPPAQDYVRIMPEIVLAVTGTLVMFLEGLFPDECPKPLMAWTAIAGLCVALWGAVLANGTPGTAFSGIPYPS